MLRCKHVAEALAKKHYQQMSFWEKLALKTHVALCVVCGKFHKDVMKMQWAVDELRRREETDDHHCGSALGESCRARMQAAMDEARQSAAQQESSGELSGVEDQGLEEKIG